MLAMLLLTGSVLLPGSGAALAQDCGAALAGAVKLEAEKYALAFRTDPERVSVGRHFSVDMVVCPKSGAGEVASVKVDAHMPDHRHGMNYKAKITDRGQGRFEAQGLMFHMPGRWEFLFDVEGKDGPERLTRSMVLR